LLHSEREPWRLWFKAAGVRIAQPQRGPTFSDAALLLSAAVSGQGIALARDVLVQRDLTAGRVVRLLHASIPSTCAYHAVFVRRAARPEVDSFVEWLVTECKREQLSHPAIKASRRQQ